MVLQLGRDWTISADAVKPVDKRITIVEYKKWWKNKDSMISVEV